MFACTPGFSDAYQDMISLTLGLAVVISVTLLVHPFVTVAQGGAATMPCASTSGAARTRCAPPPKSLKWGPAGQRGGHGVPCPPR